MIDVNADPEDWPVHYKLDTWWQVNISIAKFKTSWSHEREFLVEADKMA